MYSLTKREIASRYRGSMLGVLWAFITPMAMLAVFTFVFAGIFQAKWHGAGDTVEFALNMYAGLVAFWCFAEVVGKAPSLIYSQPNFVTKVVFPLEILPIVSVIAALFHFLINISILFIAVLIYKGSLPFTILATPIIVIAMLPLLAGLGWFLSAVGVYIRDISAVIGVALNMLMFLSPIFYPLEATPLRVRWLMELNPLTFIIECIRGSAIDGVWFSAQDTVIYFVVSLVIGFVGFLCFRALRDGFADVL